MPLQIAYSPASVKAIQRLPKKLLPQVVRKIEQLAESPESGDVKRLHGELRDYLRCRAGSYRVWFFVRNGVLHVVDVTDRKDGYD